MSFSGTWFCVLSSLILVTLGGCSRKELQTLPQVNDFSRFSGDYYSGTPQVWGPAMKEVRSTKKAQTLLLDHGEDALALRVNLIRSAQKSVRIQTFAWVFDEVGKAMVWELVRAHLDRGIKVEILVDHMFTDHDPKVVAYLSSLGPGFQLKYFNPSVNRLSPSLLEKVTDATVDFHRYNARMHNKLFVVDERIAITGGRNISNEYYDQSIGRNYKDRDVLAILPDADDITDCLDLYWNDTHAVSSSEMLEVSKYLADPSFVPDLNRSHFCSFSVLEELEANTSDPNWIRRKFAEKLKPTEGVLWIYDSPQKISLAPVLRSTVSQALTDAIAAARSEVVIQSPYFVLSDDAQRLLREIKVTHPDIKMIVSTNSLAATDNWPTYAAHYGEKRIYLEDLGLEMWEFKPIPEAIDVMMSYQKLLRRLPLPRETIRYGEKKFKIDQTLPPTLLISHKSGSSSKRKGDRLNPHLEVAPYLSMHAKSLVVDGKLSYVGSYNLDPRSDSYNTEVGVLVVDHDFATRLRGSILTDASPSNSYLIGSKKKKPILSAVNWFFNVLSEKFPFLDLWPIRSHTSYRLRKGMEPVPEGDPSFFKNWEDVGNFPGLSLWAKKQISARLFKTTGMIFKPLL
jgi:cardiolipin synthase C